MDRIELVDLLVKLLQDFVRKYDCHCQHFNLLLLLYNYLIASLIIFKKFQL